MSSLTSLKSFIVLLFNLVPTKIIIKLKNNNEIQTKILISTKDY